MGVVTSESVFTGVKSSVEDCQLLMSLGFVHITGLKSISHDGKIEYIIGDRLETSEMGKYEANNGKFVVVTTGGEIWLKSARDFEGLEDRIAHLCPNGNGAYVPLSNGQSVNSHAVLLRVSDPYDGLRQKM